MEIRHLRRRKMKTKLDISDLLIDFLKKVLPFAVAALSYICAHVFFHGYYFSYEKLVYENILLFIPFNINSMIVLGSLIFLVLVIYGMLLKKLIDSYSNEKYDTYQTLLIIFLACIALFSIITYGTFQKVEYFMVFEYTSFVLFMTLFTVMLLDINVSRIINILVCAVGSGIFIILSYAFLYIYFDLQPDTNFIFRSFTFFSYILYMVNEKYNDSLIIDCVFIYNSFMFISYCSIVFLVNRMSDKPGLNILFIMWIVPIIPTYITYKYSLLKRLLDLIDKKRSIRNRLD